MPPHASRLARLSTRHPWLVVLASAGLVLAAILHVAHAFSINTDTARLISAETPWRKTEIAFDTAFPHRVGLVVAVIEGRTPEQADEAAARLAERLKANPRMRRVQRPDAGAFLERNGLLLLPHDDFRSALRDMVRQQPLLSTLAADPGLGGILDALRLAARGVREGEATLADVTRALDALSTTIEAGAKGAPEPVSWRGLIAREAPSAGELRRFILIQPELDFSALQPGGEAIAEIRAAAADLGIRPGGPASLRLTGPVPLADEEFATVAEGALANTLATIAVVLGLLFAGLRSGRLVLAVMATMLAGLAITAGLGLLLVKEYNLISVAFAVLFVGLGVDFSIQLAVRYREIRHEGRDLLPAITEATDAMRRPLLLAAASTAIGFLAFLPTPFRGVSELGLIAGLGMMIALGLSLTLLPALLVLLRPPAERAAIGYAALAGADRFIERHRRPILAATALLFLAGLPLLASLRFDSDPMNLRDAKVESVATFLDLARDPETTPMAIDVIAPGMEAARALATRLTALPEVRRVVGLPSFVPEDQETRLAAIQDAAIVMDTVLEPVSVKPARDQAAMRNEIAAAREDLARLIAEKPAEPGLAALRRFVAALEMLADLPSERYRATEHALVSGIAPLLTRIRDAFEAAPITLEALPDEIRADWLAGDGRTRLDVMPKGDMTNEAELRRFVAAVRAVAPEATGVPVVIIESGRTVVQSFLIAAGLSLVAITALLLLLLRSWHDVLVTLVPLVVAVLMSLMAGVLLGIPLSFANIIALPLMCGVSVAFHIYFVLAWRRGVADVLASGLTRAILFSALTTAAAFGSLWLSSHPGTASMGKLLTLSLAFTLLAAFVFVPAFLGPPPQDAKSE